MSDTIAAAGSDNSQRDPLDGDWSEGLRGPARALGVPEPRPLDATAASAPIALPGPAAPPPALEAEAPDAWASASEDPLHSEPPPGAEEPLPAQVPAAAAVAEEDVPIAIEEEPGPEPVLELRAEDAAEPAKEPEVWSAEDAAEPAREPEVWSAETVVRQAPVWDPAVDESLQPPATVHVAPEATEASADWGAVSSGPDWSAPAQPAPAAAEAWDAPAASTWSAQGPAWEAAPPEPASDWAAPPAPAPAPRAGWTPTSNTMLQLETEPEPIAPEPGAAKELFGSVPQGGSLSAGDDDADLPALVPEEEEPASFNLRGEHRVAVHTRGGQTRRGTMRDVDLAAPDFTLAPQGGGAPETIQHGEVKAIFFMLAPGERPPPPAGHRVRVTFADGRTIEGAREGSDGRHGFFLVPADAARTNTRRIYIARDAVSELKDG